MKRNYNGCVLKFDSVGKTEFSTRCLAPGIALWNVCFSYFWFAWDVPFESAHRAIPKKFEYACGTHFVSCKCLQEIVLNCWVTKFLSIINALLPDMIYVANHSSMLWWTWVSLSYDFWEFLALQPEGEFRCRSKEMQGRPFISPVVHIQLWQAGSQRERGCQFHASRKCEVWRTGLWTFCWFYFCSEDWCCRSKLCFKKKE